jgi:hypothetical protein
MIAGILITGCTTVNIPLAYQFKPKDIQNNPYGCWTVLTVSTEENEPIVSYAGELLACENDTFYLLALNNIVLQVDTGRIVAAKLYTHKNQGDTYFFLSGALAIPGILGALIYTENAGAFLMMGFPVAVIGIFTAVNQWNSKVNELIYPQKNTLNDFVRYARFPAGLPEDIHLELLRTKKLEVQSEL